MQRSQAARCPLHVTLTCVHVRAVPSTFDKYLRASRIAVPLCPHHHCRSWRTPPHQRTSEMSAWPCALTVKPGDCDTGRVSMPTVTLETQLFSPVQQVGHAPASTVRQRHLLYSWMFAQLLAAV